MPPEIFFVAPLLRLPVDLLLREGTDSLLLEVHRLENLLPLFYFGPGIFTHTGLSKFSIGF